jgi:signal transduction histidine kinase
MKRYGIAVVLTVAAFGACLTLQRLVFAPNYVIFAAAVALAARYGGTGPAALTSASALVLIDYYFLPPLGTLEFRQPEQGVNVLVFGIVAFVIVRTTSQLRRAQADADRLRLAAEDLARAREEVLAVVAHDLRNPLGLVDSSAELLLEVEPERRNEMIGIMRRSVRQMNRLIGDLLDLTRIQSGGMPLDLEASSVGVFFAHLTDVFAATALRLGIHLELANSELGLPLLVDVNRVHQVLDNLVANALKFTPRGGTISVSAESYLEGRPMIRFCVRDDGAGIAPADMPRLFDRFWQSRRSDHRGVGLGLAICKGIVEAHGGRIWCDSELGHGSAFWFTIPADVGRQASRRAHVGM